MFRAGQQKVVHKVVNLQSPLVDTSTYKIYYVILFFDTFDNFILQYSFV